MAKYSDEYRASAIAMLTAEGYPVDATAIKRVYGQLEGDRPNVRTLRYWFQNQHKPAPEKLIQEKKEGLADLFEKVAEQYVRHAMKEDVVAKSTGAGAMTAAAIAVDKMRLLRDLPTEIVGVLPVVMEAYRALVDIGEDPALVFGKLVAAAKKRNIPTPSPSPLHGEGKKHE